MAEKRLKCWRRHATYGKKMQGRKSVADTWTGKKKDDLVDVRDGTRNGEPYVNVSIYPVDKRSIEKNFKNRREALKFAKAYMKKYDVC